MSYRFNMTPRLLLISGISLLLLLLLLFLLGVEIGRRMATSDAAIDASSRTGPLPAAIPPAPVLAVPAGTQPAAER